MHSKQIEPAVVLLAVLALASPSASAAPTAADDSYSVNANGVLTVAAGSGLLANDTGFDPATHRLENVDAVGQYGGRLLANPDGSFRYDPPPGFRGLDAFGYTVRSADGASSAVVRIDVSGDVVWFVNGSAAPGGNGTFGAPFNSFAPVNGSGGGGDVDALGDIIFVYAGTYTGVEFDLEAGQRLIGHSVGLDLVGTQNDVAASSAPVLGSASSFPIVEIFGQGGTIRGLRIENTAGWAIRSAAAPNGGFTIADVVIASSGSATGSVEFLNSTGAMNLSNISIDGALSALSPALQMIGTGGTMSLTNVDVGAGSGFTGGYVLNVAGNAGAITFDATSSLSSTNTRGLNIGTLAAAGSASLPPVSIAGGATSEPLVRLQSNNAASLVSFAGGVVATSTATDSAAFLSDGGRLGVGGTSNILSASDGPALYLESVELTADATFASLSSTSSNARGISIDNPVGAFDVVVTGTTTISGSASTYIRVSDTSPSGFALNLASLTATGAQEGISITGAAFSVTDSASTLATTAGAALRCDGGALNVAFASLSAAGSTTALDLNGCSGTVAAAAGALTSTAAAGDAVVRIFNSSLALTYGGSVTKNTAGRAVSVDGLNTPGSATFNGIVTATNASAGVSIANSARPVSFSTLNLGTSSARHASTPVQLAGNTGAINFGNVAIYTNGAPALSVAYANASPGQVSTGASSLLDVTGAATALSVSHATSQPLALQFASISSTGAGTHGISLNRTSGSLSVTGLTSLGAKTTAGIEIANSSLVATFQEVDITGATGDGVRLTSNGVGSSFTILGDGDFVSTHTNGAGGIWTNIGGSAFNIDGARDVRATDLSISNAGNHGVLGRGIANLLFSNVDMSNIGNADNEHVFNLREGETSGAPISGDFEVNNSVIENFTDNGVYLENFTGTLNLRWTNNVLRNNLTTTACGGGNCNGNGILLRADGTARINAFIQNAVFENIDGIALTANPEGNSGARMDIAVVSSAFTAAPYAGPSHTNNGETAISLRNAQGNSTLNFRLFSNDVRNYSGEFALGVVAFEGGDFTTTNGVISDLYIYNAHEGDAIGIFSDGANTAGGGPTNYDLILSFDNLRTPGGTAGSSFYFSGNGAISGSDANAQITLTDSQFPSTPSKAFWRTVDLTFDSGSANFSRACFNISGNQVAAGSSGLPAVDLYYIGSTQVRLQGMVGSGDVNAQNRLNSTNTLGSPAAVGTLNNITSATCTVPTLPAVFPFN